MIDYRSDTVTRPTPAMLEFMFNAPLGDDVFGEDPTVNELESYTADLFHMEAGLFCPSGTMTNQIAIKCHTQPGDEIICDELSHIYQYEGGGIGFNSGCSVKLLPGDRGRISSSQVEGSINNRDDVHKAYTRLVSLENTANRGGGSCYDFDEMKSIRRICDANGLSFHLDGARLFNALVAKNEKPEDYGKLFDSISICLSKGLGAPVGSVLLGTTEFIKKAKRYRKIFGGGMRQAGTIAAGGLFALQNNVLRLKEDHQHAAVLAQALGRLEFVGAMLPVETNILIFEVRGRYTAKDLAAKLKANNIFAIAISNSQVRMVVHLDITAAMVEETVSVLNKL